MLRVTFSSMSVYWVW